MVDSVEKSMGTMDLKAAKLEGIFSWPKRDKYLSNSRIDGERIQRCGWAIVGETLKHATIIVVADHMM
ncbi:hypothetical protein ASG85_23660 [Paenibacillus sp. Soil724D2]|nr:hypothetical protein ASG85_23660 [Paenibacillus sp. Soil724D2]